MGHKIRIHEVGRQPRLLHVFDEKGKRRDAYFDTHADAKEAQGLIYVMRIDTAFIKTELEEWK